MEFCSFEKINSSGGVRTVYTPIGVGGWGFNKPEDYANYEALGRELGITPADMVRVRQKHTGNVRIVERQHAGEGVVRDSEILECDGMITNVPGILLCTVEADCVPVYLYDPKKRAVGMLHSGWKGTAKQIAANAVRLMEETYGSDPADIMVAIGPCICRDCYEVSDDLIPPFAERYSGEEMQRLFTPKPNGRYYLDLIRAIVLTLGRAGVSKDRIETSGFCTFHSGKFYSWRKDAHLTNHMLTAIILK